jgi:hypothetical protein
LSFVGLGAEETEWLASKLKLVVPSLVPGSPRFRALDSVLKKLRSVPSRLELSESERAHLGDELHKLPLEQSESRIRSGILRKLGFLE